MVQQDVIEQLSDVSLETFEIIGRNIPPLCAAGDGCGCRCAHGGGRAERGYPFVDHTGTTASALSRWASPAAAKLMLICRPG